MRTLLEIHYDDVHIQRWKEKDGKVPDRKGKYQVLKGTINAHRKRLCQRLQLPKEVKDILTMPRDEDDLAKLEKLREAIVKEIEGRECVLLETTAHIESIASSVERCKRTAFVDELGENCRGGISAGSRVVLEKQLTDKASVAAKIRRMEPNESIEVLTRPCGTARCPPLDAFGKKMLAATNVTELMEKEGDQPEQLLDKMLLCLHDALFLTQSELWSKNEVANLKVDETPELARWFINGYKVGTKPIFDGICSMCGALLFGVVDGHSGLSNKSAGPPTDRDGTILTDGGALKIDAQPPFLLRYSPSLFAQEAPAMFKHDPETNRLSIIDGMKPPWLRKEHARSNKAAPWYYCVDCKDRYFKSGKRERGHIPFRDKASQFLMKKMHERDAEETEREEIGSQGEKSQSSQEEPEGEPDLDAEDGKREHGESEADEAENAENEKDAMDVDEEDEVPDKTYPSLETYQLKWDRLLAQHSKIVPGDFSHANLVPQCVPELWQNCPHVPFDRLKSNDAVSRLSRCRPLHGFTPAHCADNVIRYAHNTGEVNFRKRHPLQLASTLGFILNKRKGYFPGLQEDEKAALHECLTWLRQQGNNPVCFYGHELEIFDQACKRLMAKIKQFLPEGSSRARIRATNRVSKTLEDGTIGDTLGDEARGLVVLDFEGHPHKFDQVEIMADVVAKEVNILKIDAPRPEGRGWKRTYSEIDTQEDLGEEWRQDMARGARYVLEESHVKANDPHYDAKCYPHMHPYGTGSVLSEPHSGSPKGHFRNRACQIQSLFRRCAMWAFWKLDWLIKHELFNLHYRKTRQHSATASSQDQEPDPYKRNFGTAIPKNIPESSAWWKEQAKDLFALTEEHELGMMSCMLTQTHNDHVPEMLANIRRGPFSPPTPEEHVEYLFTRVRSARQRSDFENFGMEHVLSYQRRVAATKEHFMRRNHKTPLGIVQDYWDRSLFLFLCAYTQALLFSSPLPHLANARNNVH